MDSHPCVLVGCGNRAQVHAQALTQSDRFELVAACDVVPEKAERTAETFAIPATYTDVATAIREEAPAHVSVITKPNARIPLVPEVIGMDTPSVLIEKPVANTLDDVRRIAEAAATTDTRVTVCHQKPWADELVALKEWIDDGRLGEITRCVATTKLGLAGQGTHFIHTLNWLLDAKPALVHGWAHDPEPLDVDADHAEPGVTLYELTYPDDTRAFLHQGIDAPDVPEQDPISLNYKLDITGSDGRAEFILGHHARGVFRDGEERVPARDFDENAYMTQGLYDDLGATLSGEIDSHPSDLESAVLAHRVIDAVLRSAVEHRPIAPGENPPAIGTTTVDRVGRILASRTPVIVSSLMYGDRDRETMLASLAEMGVHHVDLWATEMFVDHHVGGPEDTIEAVKENLDRYDMSAPVVSIYDDEPVVEKLELASAVGAHTAVMSGRSPTRPETWDRDALDRWLDAADNLGITLAFENHLDTLETIDEMQALLETLDHPAAGICLAPPHLWVAGERVTEAVSTLGDDIEVLYLWDMEPGTTRDGVDEIWWNRADSQVPGGGGAVDFTRYLASAIEHCPHAQWVLCYHGTEEWDQDRIEESIARGRRYVEARRPRSLA